MPASPRDRPALGVAVDFVHSQRLEQDGEFCKRLQNLDGLLIHPSLFMRLAATSDAATEVTDFLRTQGFGIVSVYRDKGMSLFRRPGVW